MDGWMDGWMDGSIMIASTVPVSPSSASVWQELSNKGGKGMSGQNGDERGQEFKAINERNETFSSNFFVRFSHVFRVRNFNN
jgi:hypothetical protein